MRSKSEISFFNSCACKVVKKNVPGLFEIDEARGTNAMSSLSPTNSSLFGGYQDKRKGKGKKRKKERMVGEEERGRSRSI
jgi:hypothetical protein